MLIVLLVIVADQALKFFIKTHFSNGDDVKILGGWFRLHFIENEGMAYGMKLSESVIGKILLSSFRLIAVVFGFFLLKRLVNKKYTTGVIICGSLILAGALGNLIDSMFYGLIFEESAIDHVARMFPAHGYAGFLHGSVVDMLYFPLIKSHYPGWIPFLGGDDFEFFSPVFNIADASISVGVIAILLFQKRFFHKQPGEHAAEMDAAAAKVDAVQA